MNKLQDAIIRAAVEVVNTNATSSIVLVCEHASAFIPQEYNDLGLTQEARLSHAAWDPGARGVAVELSAKLNAVLVASRISRLVYDCNRPPGHANAMPARSEIYDVPGNFNLSEAEKNKRHDLYYLPFRNAVADAVAGVAHPLLVTIHSFTPVYHGVHRQVEIGILHDDDDRLANAMLDRADQHTKHLVKRNEPYGPVDGVTHTVAEHATPRSYPNVMIEVRNDLIATPETQAKIASQLAGWLIEAVQSLDEDGRWTV